MYHLHLLCFSHQQRSEVGNVNHVHQKHDLVHENLLLRVVTQEKQNEGKTQDQAYQGVSKLAAGPRIHVVGYRSKVFDVVWIFKLFLLSSVVSQNEGDGNWLYNIQQQDKNSQRCGVFVTTDGPVVFFHLNKARKYERNLVCLQKLKKLIPEQRFCHFILDLLHFLHFIFTF